MTPPKSAAEKCAEGCGLTLGTDQAYAVITGYELGYVAGVEDARELVETLGRIAAQEITNDGGRFGQITDAAAVLDARQALARFKALTGEK